MGGREDIRSLCIIIFRLNFIELPYFSSDIGCFEL